MSPRIQYEVDDGIDILRRDDYHTHKEQFVTAFDESESEGVARKVKIPVQRVVRIDE